jgi:hypothetical protein
MGVWPQTTAHASLIEALVALVVTQGLEVLETQQALEPPVLAGAVVVAQGRSALPVPALEAAVVLGFLGKGQMVRAAE